MAGARAETRDFWGESIEEQNLKNKKPRGTSVPDGSAIGDRRRVCIWGAVSAIEIAAGTGASDRGDGARYRANRVSDVEVQSGIRSVECERLRKEVRRTTNQVYEEESRQTRFSTHAGLSVRRKLGGEKPLQFEEALFAFNYLHEFT